MVAKTVLEFDAALCGQGLDARRLPSTASGFPMWLVDAEQSNVEAFEHLLSSEEMETANRFRFRALRHRYIAAHGALHMLLRDRYGVPADAWDIGKDSFGKPHLIRFPQIHYSLSYSGGFAMLGINESEPVGVDIEVLRTVEDAAELMDLHFTEAEQSVAMRTSSPDACYSKEFLEIWVRKEACVKACGRGLSIPLKDVECVSEDQVTTVQFGGGRYRTGALELGDPIMAWSRRTSL